MDINQSNYRYQLIKEFQDKCLKGENFMDDIWEKINLCDFKKGMKDIALLFIQLEEMINYAISLNKNKDLRIEIDVIFEKLSLLENAMKIPDYILVADLIKYEIKPIVKKWRLKINKSSKINLN